MTWEKMWMYIFTLLEPYMVAAIVSTATMQFIEDVGKSFLL